MKCAKTTKMSKWIYKGCISCAAYAYILVECLQGLQVHHCVVHVEDSCWETEGERKQSRLLPSKGAEDG